METKTNLEWQCTDIDNFQYGMQISDTQFKFREFDRNTFNSKFEELSELSYEEAAKELEKDWNCPDFWVETTIDLADYDNQMIREVISAYYNSLESLIEIYDGDSNWVIAECIFEQESNLY